MARPINADGQRTRQAILDAALGLFAERGYFGTSLRDVARAVGVRESALYNYFPGKEALFEAILAADSAAKLEGLAAILDSPDGDGRAMLEDLATFFLDRFVVPQQQQLFRILMSDGVRLAREGRINLLDKLSSGRPRLEDVMQRLIDDDFVREADPELLVMQFMGPLILWRHLHAIGAKTPHTRNRRAFARAHVDQFLNGAAVESSAEPSRVRRARTA
jgi:AcrR family transcriptional regulator